MKRLMVLFIILLFMVPFIPGVEGYTATFIVDSYTTTNVVELLQDHHPSDSATYESAVGQTFRVSINVKLYSAKFNLQKTLSPTGNAYVRIYDMTGTYGTNGVPTGAALATSDAFDVSGLTTSPVWREILFTGANQITLYTGVDYCAVFENPAAGTIDVSNYVRIGLHDATPTHTGNYFEYLNGAWVAAAGSDTAFYVYGAPLPTWSAFYFDDAVYENTTDAGSVTVTAHTVNGTEEFTVDGADWWYGPQLPIAFSWAVGAATRYIYVMDEENFTVTLPDDTAYIYGFIVRDYTGKTGEGQAYLEAWRTIGGVDTLVERMPLQQPNPVPMNLVYGKVYRMRVLFSDGSRFDWGYFVAGSTSSITIILRTVEFTDQAQVLYNHITVEATRDATGTIITVDYLDTRANTVWANVTIRIRNGAVVLNAPRNNDTYTVNWNGADAALGYVVTVEGEHTDYGEWGYSKILDQDEAFPPGPDVTGIFDLGVGPNFGPWLLVMGSVVGFSVRFQARGVLAGAAMVSLLSYIGWASWSWEINVFAWFLAVVITLIGGKE